ncbi:hypothetical protein DFA_06935 [Cavenderia fasciculata]|uniref:Uncharacterized protein n=1 Tax=Cavenderia fasciculata TaxID=261658 RepID=F4PX30_CACFS|nr:uncharacterized protein DFA_06935 [Cavenderia fasciculata]EGG19833.1 hypothetical protein DFA_06935 [Cavenderia fasciculata]|eukprot:XP_004358179.1 hypothetical protein DFA_06935 [Cavenderia fasciculata]
MNGTILDQFVGNEEIRGTIVEEFKDQPIDTIRIVLVTLISSYTKMISVHDTPDSTTSIYCGYKDGTPVNYGGLVYSSQIIKTGFGTKPNILFSFWKSKDFELLERITDRYYPLAKLRGSTIIISWPNKNDSSYFLSKSNRLTPNQIEDQQIFI